MLSYLLKVTLCWAAFYLVYHLLLRRETFFRLNRWYLLGTTLLGLLLPALELNWQAAEAPEAVYYLQPITIGMEQLETVIVTSSMQEQTFDFWALLSWIYWGGAGVALARFGYGLFQIFRLYLEAEKAPGNGYRFVMTQPPHVPFSFFKNLFWSKKFEVSEADRQSIIRHEEAHIFQKHSLDVMLLELAGVFLWCSPFIYLYKNAMKTTHEYLADAYVTQGFSKKQYGRLLLRQSQSGMQIAISNSLFSSQLKKRIVMMTKNKSSQWASLRYLAAMPVMALLFLAFSSIENEKAPLPEPAFTSQTANTPGKIHPVVKNAVEKNDSEPAKSSIDTVPDTEVFKVVEEMPRFPGCEELNDAAERKKCAQVKMLEFINSHIKYPYEAKENDIQGMVVVRFIIEKDGSISGTEIVRSLEGGCDEEVLKAVGKMPRWVPGKQQGRTVRTEFLLPVKFKMDDQAPQSENNDQKQGNPPPPGEVFKVVEVMPVFSGCEDAENPAACSKEKLVQFIIENLKYPEAAKKAGVEGTAIVKFVVGEDGAVMDAKVVKGFSAVCEEEALRVVNALPAWAPGTQNGKAVAVEMALPFKFALPKKKGESSVHSTARLEVFDVYPNPSGENGFFVKYKTEPGQLTIRLTDASGKFLSETPVSNYDGTEQTAHMTGIFEKKAAKSNVIVSLYLDGKHLESTTVVMQ